MKILGFTGTRNGCNFSQLSNLLNLLNKEKNEETIGLHGDCIGADAQFDHLCKALEMETFCLPCNFENMRAHVTKALAEPVAPMERNRNIVARADVMFACPPNEVEIKSGSGTWATIRFSKKADKPLWILFPSGKIDFIESI